MTTTSGPVMRHISNSEVGAWLVCRRQYFYSFALNLEPKKHSAPLSRGILGHDSIAAFYLAIKEGKSFDEACKISREVLRMAMRNVETFDMEIVMDVDRILNAYFPMTRDDLSKWEILEVEEKHDLPMTDQFDMPLRLDLLVKVRETGEIVLIDHKYTYDFWTEDDLALNPQFPKYVGALRNADIPIAYCILNQIRTRHLKAPTAPDLVRRSIQRPSNAKIRRTLTEHIMASQEIVEFRSLAPEVQSQVAVRTLNKMVCRSCFVKTLCQAELDGGDIQYLAQNDYKTRTYGYNDNEPKIEDLL